MEYGVISFFDSIVISSIFSFLYYFLNDCLLGDLPKPSLVYILLSIVVFKSSLLLIFWIFERILFIFCDFLIISYVALWRITESLIIVGFGLFLGKYLDSVDWEGLFIDSKLRVDCWVVFIEDRTSRSWYKNSWGYR